MREFGLLRMDIVLEKNIFEKSMFSEDLFFLEPYCNGIFINAFDYDKRKKLNSIDDINLVLDTTYIIEYRIDNNNFFIEFYKNYFMISFSKYSDVPLFEALLPILRKYTLLSNFTLVGFETTLNLDQFPNSISPILDDKSLYPLYVKQVKGSLSFKQYAGYRQMEEHIVNFLQDVFGGDFQIM